ICVKVKREKQRSQWIEGLEKQSQSDNTEFTGNLDLMKQLFVQGNAETRLESIGYRVGIVMVEKIAKDLPRFNTELDKMKFLCKEFWTIAFGKQVDNLRTNHQGVYVVQDNHFFVLLSFAEGKQYCEQAAVYLAVPSGIIRGALANMGIKSLVTATVETLPAVKFHIHMQ
uniref:Trafficking protein particle complex subunit 6B n=1 Tax=Syphacia muris TaxID=451379 RepID=A0A0N5AWJ3_9BILA